MSQPIIRLGDFTTHGGVVVSGAPATTVDGIPPARVGDMTTCPISGHGANAIVSGDSTTIVDGSPVARQGDMTACGASLIASQAASNS
jgi:uncharacterized Zn-binding protein involved in type VI secretion